MMTKAAIIGGGFAGMAIALAFKKHGITATIYETRDEAYTSGGNIALAPNALRVLDHIGVFDKIRTQGYNYEELAFASGTGTTLGVFLNGSEKKYDYQALRIHRTVVRDALREQCKAEGIITHYEKKCTSITENSDIGNSVTVTFADGETMSANFLIGADGIHSTVRKHLAPNAEQPHFSGLMGVMGTVMASELEGIKHGFNLPAMLFGDSGSFAIMPASYSGDEVGYFATLEEQDRSREEWDALGHDKQKLHEMLEQRFVGEHRKWPEFVQASCKKTPPETLTCWPFFSAPHLDSWVSKSNRVFLIGDSAHAIPPTGGQGAAMALEDAETLAYTIAESLTAPPPPTNEPLSSRLARLTAAWNAHRQARVAKVMDFTTKNGTLRKSSAHFYEQAAKEWLMWATFKWTGPEAGMRWMYEYSAESVRAALT